MIEIPAIGFFAVLALYGVIMLAVLVFWARDRAALKEARKNDARDPKTGRFISSK